MNSHNNKNKVSYIWVLVALGISISVAYASNSHALTVQELNKQKNLESKQQELNFPGMEQWSVGKGQFASWVSPRQKLVVFGETDYRYFNMPEYKVNLDSSQPVTQLNAPDRLHKRVGRVKLFSWD